MKKKRTYKYVNGCKGVISLFMCIVMLPVFSIAASFIEFSRYQGAAQVIQEVMDCSSLSTLANYDDYVEQRFGLFAVSQGCDVNDEFNGYIDINTDILEGAASIGDNVSAKGVMPLSEFKTLKQQVLDYSETTVLSEILLEDLNISDLIDKLENLEGFANIANTASGMATLTEKINQLVTDGQALVNALETASACVSDVRTNAEAVIDDMESLASKMNENSFVIDEEDEDKSYLEQFVSDYLEDVEDLYIKVDTLIVSVESLETTITDIPSKVTAFKNSFEAMEDAIEDVTNSASSDSQTSQETSAENKVSTIEETTGEATDIYQAVIVAVQKAVDEATTQLKEDTINNIKATATSFIDELKETLSVENVFEVDFDEYFELPLSDEAKRDVANIIEDIKPVFEEGDTSSLIEKYKPDELISNAFYNVKVIVNNAVENAKNAFVSSAKNSLGTILTTLVNAIRELFNLDVFYNGSLNSTLSDDCYATLLPDAGGNNPYERLLNAISKFLNAADSITEGISNWDFGQLITGMKSLFEGIGETFAALTALVTSTIDKIKEVVGYTQGNWEGFYELLLMSGYMTHNLPNRTMVSGTKVTVDGTIENTPQLTGKSLTGYKYGDIMIPSSAGPGGFEGLTGLTTFLRTAKDGGSDTMFKGAELEYILAGTKSEIMNQTVVFMQLYMLRMLFDLINVFTDDGVATMAAGATIASWAVYLIVILAEPLVDTVLLVNGAECYLYKNSCYLTPAGIPKMIDALLEVASNNEQLKTAISGNLESKISGKLDKKDTTFTDGGIMKMDYSTHALLLLMFTTSEADMITRLANLVHLESRAYYAKQGVGYTFDIRNAYTGIESTVDIELNSFLSVFQTESSGVVKKRLVRQKGY